MIRISRLLRFASSCIAVILLISVLAAPGAAAPGNGKKTVDGETPVKISGIIGSMGGDAGNHGGKTNKGGGSGGSGGNGGG
ncbi:MAG: hypothetical protein H8E15_02115 [Planctomycetes bacterium]|nr:hypothetical protein [Planctomycetota bacterium]